MNQTTSHPSVPFFALPVALKFINSTQSKTIVVDNKNNGEIFLRDIGFIADTVLVDPDYWLVTKNNTAVKLPMIITNTGIRVYPNPVGDQFNIFLQNLPASSAVLNLYNAAGQLVWSKNSSLVNGSEFIEVPSANLAKGEYTLRVIAGNDFRFVKKLLK